MSGGQTLLCAALGLGLVTVAACSFLLGSVTTLIVVQPKAVGGAPTARTTGNQAAAAGEGAAGGLNQAAGSTPRGVDGASMAMGTPAVGTGEGEDGPVPMSWADYESGRRQDAAQRRASAAAKLSALTTSRLSYFKQLAVSMPPAEMRALDRTIDAIAAAAANLDYRMDQLSGVGAPGMSRVKIAIHDVLTLLKPLVAQLPVEPVIPPVPEGDLAMSTSPVSPQNAADGASAAGNGADLPTTSPAAGVTSLALNTQSIQTRDQAYRASAKIALFLRRIESHSLTPPLIERAVRWGDMTLGDMTLGDVTLGDVISDISNEGRDPSVLDWVLNKQNKT